MRTSSVSSSTRSATTAPRSPTMCDAPSRLFYAARAKASDLTALPSSRQVLRKFLKDFDSMNTSDAASIDASMTEDAAPKSDSRFSEERPASAKPAAARRVPVASSPRQHASAAKQSPARPSMRAARDEFGTALPGDDAPVFEPTHWAALRPASAPVRRTLHSASHSSVIRTGNSTPRRSKCDPVSMHARHEQQWASSSFLANSPRRSVKVYSPAPVTQPRNRRRPPVSNYEVPTAKRRDALITETRQRMRHCDSQRSASRGLVRHAPARPCTPRLNGAPPAIGR